MVDDLAVVGAEAREVQVSAVGGDPVEADVEVRQQRLVVLCLPGPHERVIGVGQRVGRDRRVDHHWPLPVRVVQPLAVEVDPDRFAAFSLRDDRVRDPVGLGGSAGVGVDVRVTHEPVWHHGPADPELVREDDVAARVEARCEALERDREREGPRRRWGVKDEAFFRSCREKLNADADPGHHVAVGD